MGKGGGEGRRAQFNESHRKRKGSGTAKRGTHGGRVVNGRAAFRHADVVGERQRERERQRACASFDPPQLRSADGAVKPAARSEFSCQQSTRSLAFQLARPECFLVLCPLSFPRLVPLLFFPLFLSLFFLFFSLCLSPLFIPVISIPLSAT